MRLSQGSQCYLLLKNLRQSALVSAHFPNALPMQGLDDHHVTHQSQGTSRSLSYEAIFFSSVTINRENLNCAKRFAVVREEGPAGGLFYKDPAPPPPDIQNSTTPPSDPGDPIDSGVFNASNWAEEIALVSNQGQKVNDYMKSAPENVPLGDTPAADTLFEGHTWGWDGIDCRAVVVQNKNEPYLKNWL